MASGQLGMSVLYAVAVQRLISLSVADTYMHTFGNCVSLYLKQSSKCQPLSYEAALLI